MIPRNQELITLQRKAGGKVGLKMQPQDDGSKVIISVQAGSDAAAQPRLKCGVKIWKINGLKAVAQQDEIKAAFATGKPLRFLVDKKLDARVVQTVQRRGGAIFLAPLDTKVFEGLDVRLTYPTELPPSVRGKQFNRYVDIIPSPVTQVRLNKLNGDETTTYINANYIRSYGGRRAHEYIAAQGPLPSTTETFCRMIIEKKLAIVVQTTGWEEKGTKKCELYIPLQVGPTLRVGSIAVTTTKQTEKPGYIVREVKLQSASLGTHNCVHYHFTGWPDHGVPSGPSGSMYPDECLAMLLDVRQRRFDMDRNESPLCVHCSAGVGRTGSLIVIDWVITGLQQKEKIDINELIAQMREDRMALVQHTVQYRFSYQACVSYAMKKAAEEGAEIVAHESTLTKKSGGLSRARRESTKKGSNYETKLINGEEVLVLKRSFSTKKAKHDKDVFTRHEHGQKILSEKQQKAALAKKPLQMQPWFRSGFSRAQVEELLSNSPAGAFVVRDSTSKAGCYTLSMIPNEPPASSRSRVSSMLIIPVPQKGSKPPKYKFGQSGTELFSSVTELVHHYTENEIGADTRKREEAASTYTMVQLGGPGAAGASGGGGDEDC